MFRLGWVLTAAFFASNLNAATISSFAAGFSNETPGFWGIAFLPGAPDDRIASVTLHMPGPGFFDFDGVGNYANQTASIFDAGSSSGLSPDEVSFSFTGMHPRALAIRFAPAAFAPGDRLQFAADIDGLGSKLGGALGAYGGTQITVTLGDGRTGAAHLSTDTSVASRTTLEIASTSVPEPATLSSLIAGGVALCAMRRIARRSL